ISEGQGLHPVSAIVVPGFSVKRVGPTSRNCLYLCAAVAAEFRRIGCSLDLKLSNSLWNDSITVQGQSEIVVVCAVNEEVVIPRALTIGRKLVCPRPPGY